MRIIKFYWMRQGIGTFEELEKKRKDWKLRQRDPWSPEKNLKHKAKNLYSREDFIRLENENKYLCPAGKKLHYEGKVNQHGYKGKRYKTRKNICCECAKQHKCLRKGSSRRSIFITEEKPRRTHSVKMIEKIDTEEGRQIYSMRMGTAFQFR